MPRSIHHRAGALWLVTASTAPVNGRYVRHLRTTAVLSEKGSADASNNMLLADALNLLSPSNGNSAIKRSLSKYKPSLFAQMGTGNNSETLVKESDFKVPVLKSTESVNQHMSNLLAGINYVSQPRVRNLGYEGVKLENMSVKEQHTYIKGLRTESALLEAFDLLYYLNKLGARILNEILLNRHLKDFKKLPVSLDQLTQGDVHLKLSELETIQLKIVLMKKYYDMSQSLNIIKNLKENFEDRYLPAIKKGELGSFYERVVWKFYFDYYADITPSQNEEYFIQNLNKLRHTFLIWEASMRRSQEVVKFALNHHQKSLTFLQKCFLKMCCNDVTNGLIKVELAQSKGRSSSTLSKLKKLSIKYKISVLPDVGKNGEQISIDTRAALYSCINGMELMILDEFLKADVVLERAQAVKEMVTLLQDLRQFKEHELMNVRKNLVDPDWIRLFLTVDKWRKT